MASYTCPVDCSTSRVLPTELPAEPDISGIGITIAYTSTAAFALTLVVAYCTFVYHPSTEMSGGLHGDRPNPIDEYLLFWRLRKPRKDGENDCEVTRKARIQTAMIHAMLTMSDFQLITGLTILISGFMQLRCGITAYHWQRIVQLSWFSCITHLCCLTFLRQHFMQNKTLYAWRLPGMIALVVMLIVALVPTAHYASVDWDDHDEPCTPAPTDFAICYRYSHIERNELDKSFYASSQQRMILSAILLGGGMMNQIWHLFQTPTYVYLKLRHTCSQYSQRFLSIVYTWRESDKPSLLPFLVVVFLYRPLLAMFLTFRILVDMITSRAFEVWWLIMSFSYGIQNLWMRKKLPEPGSEKWSFGQVVAVLVLVAPLITSVEGYLQGPNQTTANEAEKTELQSLRITAPQPVSPSPEDTYLSFAADPTPGHDFYGHSFTFPIVSCAALWCYGTSTTMFLAALNRRELKPSDLLLHASVNRKEGWLLVVIIIPTPPIFLFLLYFIFCVLLALVAEIQPPKSTAKRRSFRFLYSSSCVVLFVAITFGMVTIRVLGLACMSLYVILSIAREVVRGLRSKANTSPRTQHTTTV